MGITAFITWLTLLLNPFAQAPTDMSTDAAQAHAAIVQLDREARSGDDASEDEEEGDEWVPWSWFPSISNGF